MKLAGFVQMYNEVEKGNLRRCLDSMSKYCDVICVYDDASIDESVDVALSYSKVKLIKGKENRFDQEIQHKQWLLDFTIRFEPDWIFWLDCDEIIEKRGEDGALREICENSDRDAHDFRQINFWRSERYYRLDGQYNAGIFCRLWRNTPKLRFDVGDGLHRKPYPDGIHTIKTEDIRILHYGFVSSRSIIDKYLTYKKHRQTGWELERLIDERTLRIAHTKEEWLGREAEGPTIEDVTKEGPIYRMI